MRRIAALAYSIRFKEKEVGRSIMRVGTSCAQRTVERKSTPFNRLLSAICWYAQRTTMPAHSEDYGSSSIVCWWACRLEYCFSAGQVHRRDRHCSTTVRYQHVRVALRTDLHTRRRTKPTHMLARKHHSRISTSSPAFTPGRVATITRVKFSLHPARQAELAQHNMQFVALSCREHTASTFSFSGYGTVVQVLVPVCWDSSHFCYSATLPPRFVCILRVIVGFSSLLIVHTRRRHGHGSENHNGEV